ncbi:MAG: hypothetical protein MUC97_07040 [Bernardetiaceae bacterium]|jgi:predicted flap endonuclease-1-like 5' DNA nuclease|nr:hypothetical protein [Bernardetiaceae bacterium]
MNFTTAVLISVGFLLVAAFLGYMLARSLFGAVRRRLQQELDGLRGQLEQSRGELASKRKEFDLEVGARDRKLEAIRGDYDNFRMGAEQRYGELGQQINTAKAQHAAAATELGNLQATFAQQQATWKAEIDQTNQRFHLLQNSYNELKASCEAKQAQLNGLVETRNHELTELRKQYEALQVDFRTHRTRTEARETDLMEQLAKSSLNYTTLRQKYDAYEQEMANQKVAYANLHRDYDVVKTNLEEHQRAMAVELEGHRNRYALLLADFDKYKVEATAKEAELTARWRNLNDQFSKMEISYNALKSSTGPREAELAGKNNEIDQLRTELNAARSNAAARYNELAAKLNQAESSQKTAQAETERLNGLLGTCRRENEAKDQNYLVLMREKDEQISRLNAAIAEMRLGTTAHGGAMSTAPLDEKEAELAKIKAKALTFDYGNMGTARYDDRDDLKIIVGIGPFIEEKLFALNIYTFEQISRFNDRDVEQVTQAIEFFPGRIQRDHWVDQAAELAAQKRQKKAEAAPKV